MPSDLRTAAYFCMRPYYYAVYCEGQAPPSPNLIFFSQRFSKDFFQTAERNPDSLEAKELKKYHTYAIKNIEADTLPFPVWVEVFKSRAFQINPS